MDLKFVLIAIVMFVWGEFAHISGVPIPCSNDYWNDPCREGNRPTDAPPASGGVTFFKNETEGFKNLGGWLQWRKTRYIEERFPNSMDYVSYIDEHVPFLPDLPAVPSYTTDLSKKEEEVIRNATKALMTIAVFNQQIVIDEVEFEPSSPLIAGYFQEMNEYYRDRLCALRIEMSSRGMTSPACVDLSIIPEVYKQNPDDFNRRHTRDYLIIRDTEKIVFGYAQQFARVVISLSR